MKKDILDAAHIPQVFCAGEHISHAALLNDLFSRLYQIEAKLDALARMKQIKQAAGCPWEMPLDTTICPFHGRSIGDCPSR